MPEEDLPRGAHHDESDGHECHRVEQEFEDLFREQFGVVRADLSLTEEQRLVSDRNATEALPAITASPRSAAPTTVSSLRGGRRRWFPAAAIAAAAVAATVAVGVVVELPGAPTSVAYASTPPLLQIDGRGAGNYPLTGTNADPQLERLARLAAAQPPLPGPGDIERITRLGWWLDTDGTDTSASESPTSEEPGRGSSDGAESGQRRVVPVETETLQLSDGVTRIRVQRGEPLEVGGELEVDSDVPVTSDESFPRDPGNLLDFPDRLPTQPAALRAALLGPDTECGGIEAYCLFESMSMLNLNFVLGPDLQAGLARTLVGASDIGYAGVGRDRLGRDVEVFVVDDPDHDRQYLLLFDSGTGFYAGEETVLTVAQPDLADVDVPAVIEFATVTDRSRITAAEVPK